MKDVSRRDIEGLLEAQLVGETLVDGAGFRKVQPETKPIHRWQKIDG